MNSTASKSFLLVVLVAAAVLILSPSSGSGAPGADPETDGPVIIERVIKVEGSTEKPRTIFIVPKAKLWDDDITNKSLMKEFLEPELPDRTLTGGGVNK
jgi:hypothetical protein